jgi:hypothetical protein
MEESFCGDFIRGSLGREGDLVRLTVGTRDALALK